MSGEKEPGEKEPGEKEPGEKEPGEKEPGANSAPRCSRSCKGSSGAGAWRARKAAAMSLNIIRS